MYICVFYFVELFILALLLSLNCVASGRSLQQEQKKTKIIQYFETLYKLHGIQNVHFIIVYEI